MTMRDALVLLEAMIDEAPNEECRQYIKKWKAKIKKQAKAELLATLA